MVFSSYLFPFYFPPLALGLYYLLPPRWRHLELTLVSYVFHGWATSAFTILMLVSTLIDCLAGLAEEAIAEYLTAVLETGDSDLLLLALGDITRARGRSRVAQDAGLGRESFTRPLPPAQSRGSTPC